MSGDMVSQSGNTDSEHVASGSFTVDTNLLREAFLKSLLRKRIATKEKPLTTFNPQALSVKTLRPVADKDSVLHDVSTSIIATPTIDSQGSWSGPVAGGMPENGQGADLGGMHTAEGDTREMAPRPPSGVSPRSTSNPDTTESSYYIRPRLNMTGRDLDEAKSIIIDLLGLGVQPEYLVDCGVSPQCLAVLFHELNIRFPLNLDRHKINLPSVYDLDKYMKDSQRREQIIRRRDWGRASPSHAPATASSTTGGSRVLGTRKLSSPILHQLSSKQGVTKAPIHTSHESPPSKRARVDISIESRLPRESTPPGPQNQPSTAQRPGPSLRSVQHVRPDEMTQLEMFGCLIEHGCSDLRSSVNPDRFSSYRVAEGAFGDVYKGELSDGTKHFMREIYNWSKLEHKNIHKLLGVTILEGRLGMVSKCMENGTLYRYLKQHPTINRHALCLQVTEGVAYLHSRDMIHGDLKTGNILVSLDGIPKLTDFDHSISSGFSLQFSISTHKGGGTLRWMAPELAMNEEKAKRTDVYALGMTFLEIITDSFPYSECQTETQVLMKLCLKQLPKRSMDHFLENEQGNQMWGILTQCWDRVPTSRPTAHDVLKLLLAVKV
ncbi:hypothetical protein OPQ81_002941 [Rhizoctonia solani]|nr:hypothetical protein OPQ81_002941 [Rhizoctonia solani]